MSKCHGKFVATYSDRDFVRRAYAGGCTKGEIAEALGICVETLRKNFGSVLGIARVDLRARAVEAIEEALEGADSFDAAKFVLSRLGGWVEPQRLAVTTLQAGMGSVAAIPAGMSADDAAKIYQMTLPAGVSVDAAIPG